MTFTYSPPSSDDDQKNAVRFLLGDTTSEGHLLEDQEITWAISRWFPLYGTIDYVAAALADQIASRYAAEASYSADGVSVSLGPVGNQYRALAMSLREQHKALLVGGLPDVGGVSPYEERDPNTKNFAFGTGMHDDLQAGEQDYGDRGPQFYPAENYPGC